MENISINGIVHQWADIKMLIAGVPIKGVVAIKYDEEQDKENLYGMGNYPVARGSGQVKCTASITLYSGELLALQKAAPNKRIQDFVPFDIHVCYIPKNSLAITTDVLHNCEFTKVSKDVKAGDQKVEMELPLILSHISFDV